MADLGSCKGIYSDHPYTEYISTRWYRPPECLLTDGYYDFKVFHFLKIYLVAIDGFMGSRLCFLWNNKSVSIVPR